MSNLTATSAADFLHGHLDANVTAATTVVEHRRRHTVRMKKLIGHGLDDHLRDEDHEKAQSA